MKKALRITGIVGAALLGLVLLLLVLLPLVFNSRAAARLLDKLAAGYIDGYLEYSSIHVSLYRHFPCVELTLEDVALTYPHERFAPYDTLPCPSPLLDEGRGALKDTLARFGTLDASVDILRLLRGEICADKVILNRFAAFAHNYGEAANWDILHFPKATKKDRFDLPHIRVGELRIDGTPHAVYTAQRDSIFTAARFLHLLLQGEGKLSSDQSSLKDIHLALDSLRVFGRLPKDTLDLRLDYLHLDEGEEQVFDLALGAAARVHTDALGSLVLPLLADGRVGIDHQPRRFGLDVPQLDIRLAQLPLHAEGQVAFLPGQTDLNAYATIPDCPLDSLLRRYLDHYLKLSRDISTDARLTVDVSANGSFTQESVPQMVARIRIPQSRSRYRPMDLKADLAMDIHAEMTPQKRLDARIETFDAGIQGAHVVLDGNAADLLGGNARFNMHALADASIGPLVKRFVPARLGFTEADGNARVDLHASVTQRELNDFHFQDADIRGTLTSDKLYVAAPGDTLDASLWRTRMRIASNRRGLRLQLDLDSLYLAQGLNLQARVRDMRNGILLTKVPSRGQLATSMDLANADGQLFAKIGSSRVGVDDADIKVVSTQRILPPDDARKRRLDALQEKYPDVPRADLAARLAEQNRRRPPRPHDRFADGDLAIAINETSAKLMREWSTSGSVRLDSAFFASPQFPLRTRLTTLDAAFTDNDIKLDSLAVTAGTSDLQAAGYLKGLRAVTSPRRRGVLESQVNIASNRLNINELTAALQSGRQDRSLVSPAEERDESFVVDSLRRVAKAETEEKTSLVVMPGNVRATVGISVDTLDVAELQFGPILAAARLQDRTAQILGAHVFTEVGHIGADGYYATRSAEDISAGVNIDLRKVSVPGIISMVRHADKLPPVIRSMQGRLDCNLSATTQIDTNMNLLIPTLDGLARISGKDLEIQDAGSLRSFTWLLFRNRNIGHIDDLTIDAVAHDGRLEIFPFELGVDRYRLAIMGMQGLDRSIYYHASILKAPIPIRFGINIFGTLDHWRFSLSKARYRDGKLPVFTQQLDSVQVNIAKGIRDIFKSGAKRVRDYNLSQEHKLRQTDEEMLSSEEFRQVDDFFLLAEMEEQDEAMLEEVEDAIQQASLDTDLLIKQYTEQAYDKRILRKMERMKKQQQKAS
ncbi:MAG: hypothetical protein K6G86_09065 [Bacteroidales bacterium]|nr:hypothetical protein [Bacteroidales bacterium]